MIYRRPHSPPHLLTLTAGVLLTTSCVGEGADIDPADVWPQDVSITPSEFVSNVVTVAWHTDEPTTGVVSATAPDGETWSGRSDTPAKEHEVALLGLPEGAEVEISVTTEREGASATSEPVPTSIPWSWSGLAGLTVEEGAPGYRLTTAITPLPDPNVPDVVIFDDRGRAVWAVALPSDQPATSAKLSSDRSTLFVITGAEIWAYSLAGDSVRQSILGDLHHDCEPIPGGGVLVIQRVLRSLGEESVTADRVLLLEPDETSRVVWDSIEHLDELPPPIGEPVDGVRELTHANSIRFDEPTGDVLLSLARMGAILAFSLETGEHRWVISPFGGPLPATPEPVLLSHQAVFTETGIAVFANYTKGESCSRVLDFSTDDEAMTFSTSNTYSDPDCLESVALGGLADAGLGRRLISWSTAGVLDVIDADDQRLARIAAPLGVGFGYAAWHDSLYPVE